MTGGKQLPCRGVRGATVAPANTREAILNSTKELLNEIVRANGVEIDDIAGVFFTTTSDLNAEFPALAARELGWTETAMLCGHEMNVPGSLPRVIRVMVLWNTAKSPSQIVHVYLHEAQSLRPERRNAAQGMGVKQ
ncbi:MAG: chorismate mutase [Dehalococcoidia bacterium]|nr:chorismate mutase [Dehalococcoidia bacterium]